MGKIRNPKKLVKKIGIKKNGLSSKSEKNITESSPIESNTNFVSSIAESLKKDSDLMSVRSLKSIKNKFGIKKRISKQEKLKLKKEILKQKVDFLLDNVNSTKSSYKVNSTTKNINLEKLSTTVAETKFIQDKDEEYLKIGKKTKSIAKRKKRNQQMANDTNALKCLMFGKSKSLIKL